MYLSNGCHRHRLLGVHEHLLASRLNARVHFDDKAHSRVVREVAQAGKMFALFLVQGRLRMMGEKIIASCAEALPGKFSVNTVFNSPGALTIHGGDTTAEIVEVK